MGWNIVYGFNDSDFEVRDSFDTGKKLWQLLERTEKQMFSAVIMFVFTSADWCSEDHMVLYVKKKINVCAVFIKAI